MPSPELLITSNATDLSADGWLKIAPWGDHPNSVGLQRVQKEDGDAMVAAFNSLVGKAGRMFRGVPIFVGHPDRDPNRYPDKRRYGKITALESRADGLYAKPAFNDLGERVIEQGHYLYNSPVWALKREGGVVRPIELLSIGLTNEPNIKGEPWAKNEVEPGDTAANGDSPGHPFRGNQYTDGGGIHAAAASATDYQGDPHTHSLIDKGNNLERAAELAEKKAKEVRNAPDYYAHGPSLAQHAEALGERAKSLRNEARGYHAQAFAVANANPDPNKRPTLADFHKTIKARYDGAIMDGTMNTAPLSPAPTTLNTPTPTPETPMTAEEKAQIESQLAALNTKIADLTAALAARDAETLAANASNAAALQSAAADLAAANAKIATERTKRIELAANSIVAAGRRTTAQRAALVTELTAANDLDTAILAATHAKPALPTTSAVANLGQRKAEGQQTAGVAINEAVRAYAAEHQCDLGTHIGFNLAWNGAKAKHPALFGAKAPTA